MKKRCKALVLTLMAAVLLVLLPPSNALTARADEPATYSLKYFGVGGWRCQPGSTYVDGVGDGDLDYLNVYLKDGDSIVIYGGDTPFDPLDLSAVKLNNLTIHQNTTVVVNTGGVKDCYVLAGCYCAVNGDVTNAYLYDTTVCTFNNNVLDMTLYVDGNVPQGTSISCYGTIGRFYVHSLTSDIGVGVFYDVKTNGLIVQDGKFCMPTEKYSPTPTEEYTKAMEGADAPAAAPAPAPTPAAPSTSTSSDEYDRVPKTGDTSVSLWLFLAAAAASAGSLLLQKKAN